MIHLRKRKDIDITNRNVTLLSLGEAVKRWTADGQFMITEVNHTDAYESKDNNIPYGSMSERISKIEAALAGLDFVKEVQASSNQPEPSPAPSPEPSPAPSPEPSAQ